MDLSNCKLICRSKGRSSENTTDYKYWPSSALHPSPNDSYEEIIKYNRKMQASKSVQKLQKRIYNRPSLSSLIRNPDKDINDSYIRKNYNKLSPLPDSEVSKSIELSNALPDLHSSIQYRNYLKPNPLVPLHKPQEGKELRVMEWLPPEYRNGPIGSKFKNSKAKSKSPIQRRVKLKKIEESTLNEENSDTERVSYGYFEPYIQKILEKKNQNSEYLFQKPISFM